MSKYLLYFWLAFLPTFFVDSAPHDRWGWWKLVGLSVYQGLLAVKAVQSKPNP